MQIRIIAGVLFLLACLLLVQHYAGRGGRTLGDRAPAIGLSFPGGKEFSIRKDAQRPGATESSRSMEAGRGNTLLRLEIVSDLSEDQAAQTTAARLAMIQSLYSSLPAPYPGMVTSTIAVADSVRPVLREITIGGVVVPLYILTSNDRHTYGAMAEDSVAFRGGLCFLYNKATRTLYRLDYFIPRQEFTEEALVAFFAGIRATSGELGFPGAGLAEGVPAASGPATDTEQAPAGAAASQKFNGFNVILIALEPLGANHVGGYGYDSPTTPNLDALARDAVQFDHAVSGSSWSLPAFMSLFTSRYPSQHKVTNKYSTFTEEKQILANLTELSPGVRTMAEVFRENGYRTAGFTGDASLARDFGFALGFDEYFDGQRFAGFDLTLPKALDWLARNPNEKNFLFVQGYDVHGQYSLDRQHLPRFLDPEYHGLLQGSEEEYWDLRTRNIEEGQIAVSAEDMRFLRAIYDAKIFAADQRLGAFIAKLRETGLLEKSILIFTAGSGNEYGEHGRLDHGFSLYEELVRVPLLIRIPGRQGRIPEVVRTIDIMPTLCDLLNLNVSPQVRSQMQGVSLVPLLAGERLDLAGIAETDYLQQAFKRSIRTNEGWKLIVSLDTEQRELYNLREDPGEQHNLIESEGRVAYELEHRLFSELRNEPGAR